MAGNRTKALENIQKCIPGPGRPPDTPEKKAKRLAIKQFMKEYLESGEAAIDFEKARLKMPLAALQEAMDRVYGKARQQVENSGTIIVRINNPLKAKIEVEADDRTDSNRISD